MLVFHVLVRVVFSCAHVHVFVWIEPAEHV